MKKAIKATAILAALSLVFSAFTACSNGTKEKETTTTTTTAPETTSQTVAEQTSEAETTTTTSATESTTETQSDSIETLLNLIKSFPIGTAGSSAKSVDIALRLINFTENCENAAALEAEIDKFEDTLNDSQEAMFEECFAEIDYVARKLIAGDTNSYNAYIGNSSVKYDKGNYSLEKYEAVFKLIADI